MCDQRNAREKGTLGLTAIQSGFFDSLCCCPSLALWPRRLGSVQSLRIQILHGFPSRPRGRADWAPRPLCDFSFSHVLFLKPLEFVASSIWDTNLYHFLRLFPVPGLLGKYFCLRFFPVASREYFAIWGQIDCVFRVWYDRTPCVGPRGSYVLLGFACVFLLTLRISLSPPAISLVNIFVNILTLRSTAFPVDL